MKLAIFDHQMTVTMCNCHSGALDVSRNVQIAIHGTLDVSRNAKLEFLTTTCL